MAYFVVQIGEVVYDFTAVAHHDAPKQSLMERWPESSCRETKQWVAKEGNVEEVLKQCQKRTFLLELWPLDEGSLEKSLLAIQLFTKLRERD